MVVAILLALTKRYINTTSNSMSSLSSQILVCARFVSSIWCSVGTTYVSSDERIKKNKKRIN
jgi:hypothetical protein